MRLFAGMLLCLLLCANAGRAQTPAENTPQSVEAIAVSPTEIKLYWLPVADAFIYRIYRDGKAIGSLAAPADSYDDKKVAPDSLHSYQVEAIGIDVKQRGKSPEYKERSFAPFPVSAKPKQVSAADYDVVVVQASSGGVAAAVEAAKRGLKVALLEPTTRLGGMPVNGLSASDLRRDAHQSGFFVTFRQRVMALYAAEGRREDGRKYEPRIAHQAMKSLLYDTPNLTIFRRVRLAGVKTRAVEMGSRRRRVESITAEELDEKSIPTGRRAVFRAKVFVDATDCGDLAAGAGAAFRVGREARSVREPHNGVIYYERKTMKALPGSTGAADKRIQSYAYLLTVKDYGAGADKTLPKPDGYRREDFLDPALPTWKSTWAFADGAMPNGKHELNQHPQGNDLQEINYAYPTVNYAARAKIEAQYRHRILCYLYFIQTEYGMKQLGLPDDEYRDTGGFPSLLYVREARRIVGEQLPDEADIAEARQIVRPESVGIGDYPMDSHAVRPRVPGDTRTMGEGEWWLAQQTPWHQLPYGVMVPRQLENVLVTTAVSATHTAFGTYRMEPIRMAFGQTAGIAAYFAIRYRLPMRDVPTRQIQDELLPHFANPNAAPNVVLHYFPDLAPTHPHYRAIQYLAARGFLPDGDNFAPDAPVTFAELERWINLLAERTPNAGDAPAYMGTVRDTYDVLLPYHLAGSQITRREFLAALRQLFDPNQTAPYSANHYDDAPEDADAAVMYDYGIDSRLWDSWEAYAKNGRLRLAPDTWISHTEAFAALYLAQIYLGPGFSDHPADGRNGRRVPAAPASRPLVLSAVAQGFGTKKWCFRLTCSTGASLVLRRAERENGLAGSTTNSKPRTEIISGRRR